MTSPLPPPTNIRDLYLIENDLTFLEACYNGPIEVSEDIEVENRYKNLMALGTPFCSLKERIVELRKEQVIETSVARCLHELIQARNTVSDRIKVLRLMKLDSESYISMGMVKSEGDLDSLYQANLEEEFSLNELIVIYPENR